MATFVLVVGKAGPLHPAAWQSWEGNDPHVRFLVHSAEKHPRQIPVKWESSGEGSAELLTEIARAFEYLCNTYQSSFDVFVVPEDAVPARRMDIPVQRDVFSRDTFWGSFSRGTCRRVAALVLHSQRDPAEAPLETFFRACAGTSQRIISGVETGFTAREYVARANVIAYPIFVQVLESEQSAFSDPSFFQLMYGQTPLDVSIKMLESEGGSLDLDPQRTMADRSLLFFWLRIALVVSVLACFLVTYSLRPVEFSPSAHVACKQLLYFVDYATETQNLPLAEKAFEVLVAIGCM